MKAEGREIKDESNVICERALIWEGWMLSVRDLRDLDDKSGTNSSSYKVLVGNKEDVEANRAKKVDETSLRTGGPVLVVPGK